MKVNSIFPLAGVCLGLIPGLLGAREPVRDLNDLAKLEDKVEEVSSKVMPATVALLSEKTQSSGSGVITTADGLILTAAHVVQGAEELHGGFSRWRTSPGKGPRSELLQRHRAWCKSWAKGRGRSPEWVHRRPW